MIYKPVIGPNNKLGDTTIGVFEGYWVDGLREGMGRLMRPPGKD